MTHPVVLGVDGGNTKTIALVAGLDGTILGFARGGCSDIYALHALAPGVEVIGETAGRALAMAGVGRDDLASAGFSLAGADWPEDHDDLRAALSEAGLLPAGVVVNDALGALRGGSPDGLGVCVVCGTGIAVGARAPGGTSWHGSFWLEDNGAVSLGHAVLRAVVRAELGIAPTTSLTHRVLHYFGLESVETVLHAITRRHPPRHPPIGGLAAALLDEAAAGDTTATAIVQRAADDIGAYAITAARRVGFGEEPFPLVLAGGVPRHPSHLLGDAIATRVRSVFPAVQPMPACFEPAVGALLLAFDTLGVVLTDHHSRALRATMPEPELFHTGGVR